MKQVRAYLSFMFLELYEHIFDQTRRKLTQIAELSLQNLQRSMGENRPYKISKIKFKQALGYFIFFQAIWLLFSLKASAADKTNANVKWSVDPFAQKVFIENKGQFHSEENKKVLYKVEDDGTNMLFTSSGIVYTHFKVEQKGGGRAIARLFEKEEEEKDFGGAETIAERAGMEWLNSNPDVQVIALDVASNYFTYGDKRVKGNQTIHAFSYKKIIYKNLYPNIDVEYFFPEGKEGIKYNLILHPGADPLQIRMKFSGINSLKLDTQGNAEIETPFLKITDHAPVTCYENNERIASGFQLDGDVLTINLREFDKSRKAIIDPWTTFTVFTGLNKAYDVNYDNSGNVYAYGGSYPFELIKVNSAGVILWTFTASDFDNNTNDLYYGDFAVDEVSRISYICEGAKIPAFFGTTAGARILKVDSLGNRIGLFLGNDSLQEMWRMVFDPCTRTIVIGGGGITHPFQASILDTTGDMNITPVNVLNATTTYRDVSLLAADGYSNCFMLSARGSDNLYNNLVLKLPFPNLTPNTYSVSSGYTFIELNSVKYMPAVPTGSGGTSAGANGYNGMAASRKFVYVYNGYALKKWHNATGAVFKNLTLTGGQAFRSGGLTVDACDNLYVGFLKSMRIYDDSLKLVNTVNLNDTVYDVKMDNTRRNLVYACGKGFVAAVEVQENHCLNLSFNTTETCTNTGSAEVIVSGGLEPYTYSWKTTPVVSSSQITGLTAGNYSITVVDKSCVKIQNSAVATVPEITFHFSTDSLANVFTPNGIPPNDIFYPFAMSHPDLNLIGNYLKNFHLKVYNRWGNMIFEIGSYSEGWNGQEKNNKPALEGVYYWLAEYETNCDPPDTPSRKVNGYVHLFR